MGSFTSGETALSLTGNVMAPPIGNFMGAAWQPYCLGPTATLAELYFLLIDLFLAGLHTGNHQRPDCRARWYLTIYLMHLEL
jgi:hypothetical protein